MSAPKHTPDANERRIAAMAMGRIFRLASRPAQPGDVAEYERCRAAILDALDPRPFAEGFPVRFASASWDDNRPNFAREYPGILASGGAS